MAVKNEHSVYQPILDQKTDNNDGFQEPVTSIVSNTAFKQQAPSILQASWMNTILGPIITIASDTALYLLEFVARKELALEIMRLKEKTGAEIIPGSTDLIVSIENEISAYFAGNLKSFRTPFNMLGTNFQREVWTQLVRIPFGSRCSYLDIATAIGKPSSCRAVAGAIGCNQLALIIPCHRIIQSNGQMGGYAGGITRKKWLLQFEKAKMTQ